MLKMLRRLLLLVAMTLPFAAHGAIAIGQHTLISSGGFTQVTTLTTSAIATSATGSKFIISVVNNSGTIGTVTDSFSNTYTLKETASQFSLGTSIYICDTGCTGGSGHTATVTSTLANYSVALTEVTGAASTGFDVGASGSNFSAGSTQAGAAVTTTNANDLVFSVIGFPGSGNAVTDSGTGFSILDSTFATSDNGQTTSSAVFSSTGTYQDTYAVTGGFSFCSFATISFKAASGGTVTNGVLMSNGHPVSSNGHLVYQ